MMTDERVQSSFRDPSGFLFCRDGAIHRQINITYKNNYDHLMNSGLYQALVDSELLIPHEEVDIEGLESDKSYKIIKSNYEIVSDDFLKFDSTVYSSKEILEMILELID